jgi:hypothetical protein
LVKEFLDLFNNGYPSASPAASSRAAA